MDCRLELEIKDMNGKIFVSALFGWLALVPAAVPPARADTASRDQPGEAQAIEQALIAKEHAREAALAINDGHAEGVRTLTFGDAFDETDGPGDVMVNV